MSVKCPSCCLKENHSLGRESDLAKGRWAGKAASSSSLLLAALGETLSSWDYMGHSHLAPNLPWSPPDTRPG